MRFILILDMLHEKDLLLIEPCIVLNALAIYNMEDFDKYISLNFENKLMNIDREILPHWNGLLSGTYQNELANFHRHGSSNTDTSCNTAINLERYLSQSISNNIQEQNLYLQNYPEKIKFINSFNQLDIE